MILLICFHLYVAHEACTSAAYRTRTKFDARFDLINNHILDTISVLDINTEVFVQCQYMKHSRMPREQHVLASPYRPSLFVYLIDGATHIWCICVSSIWTLQTINSIRNFPGKNKSLSCDHRCSSPPIRST